MKLKLVVLFLVCLGLGMSMVLPSCKSYPSPLKSETILEITEMGGFTGMQQSYYLLPNGQVFQGLRLDSVQERKKIAKKEAAKLFAKADSIFSTFPMVPGKPGNLMRVLNFTKKGEQKSLVWPAGAAPAKELDDFYEVILATVNPAK